MRLTIGRKRTKWPGREVRLDFQPRTAREGCVVRYRSTVNKGPGIYCSPRTLLPFQFCTVSNANVTSRVTVKGVNISRRKRHRLAISSSIYTVRSCPTQLDLLQRD